MPARLTVHLTDRPARSFVVEEGSEYLVGRGSDCQLRIDDDRISRRHARLAATPGGGWRIDDLGSKNGLAVGGAPVPSAELAGVSWLSIGGLLARFEPLGAGALARDSELRVERWRTTIEHGRRLDPAEGLEALLRRLIDSVLRLSGGERGFVVLAGDAGELEVAAAEGMAPGELASSEFSGSVGAVERALAEGRPVVAGDALDDSRLGHRPSVVEGGIRALVCVPLNAPGGVIGVIYADSRKPGAAFTELDVEILEALATHAVMALTVARLRRELEGLAEGLEAGGELPPEAGERLRDELDRAWRRSLGAPADAETRAGDWPPAGPGRTTWSGVTAAHRGVVR
jgi:hypothetical protein